MEHLVKYWCDPAFRDRARRQALKVIIAELDKVGISIPFNQLDVHFDKPADSLIGRPNIFKRHNYVPAGGRNHW